MKKGDSVIVRFFDHSYEPKGTDKTKEPIIMRVQGLIKSQRGKILVLEICGVENEGYEHNHEHFKIIKSTIIEVIKLKPI